MIEDGHLNFLGASHHELPKKTILFINNVPYKTKRVHFGASHRAAASLTGRCHSWGTVLCHQTGQADPAATGFHRSHTSRVEDRGVPAGKGELLESLNTRSTSETQLKMMSRFIWITRHKNDGFPSAQV